MSRLPVKLQFPKIQQRKNSLSAFKKLINCFLFFFTSLSFSNLSMNLLLIKKTSEKYSPCTPALRHLERLSGMRAGHAPKRRCSSHTFRYGYLVTT